jgi:hypothetical protein
LQRKREKRREDREERREITFPMRNLKTENQLTPIKAHLSPLFPLLSPL